MSTQISGADFDVMIGDLLIHVETMNASITDNRKAVTTRGVPNGYVNGDVACSGDIELDSQNFNLLMEAAKAAGSWRELGTFDILTSADVGSQSQKFELFGCLINVADLFNIDAKGGEKTKHKLPYQVTSPDFVRINGVPYLAESSTVGL